ncbi:STAS domain-containing protein [Aliivibrio fischeri]|uniref:STAS domain-containing protein n=1 Tax=Aliivibrio fischeri TaxID=668 RepID=UPI0012D94208|nr:STAS domain-containing protein [Aliivibrio fischeri]MUK26931.1 STAS domain-containing protein [Aliivibrio fischeri]MUK32671.1 STAS domain-containing protein [Aliivibrio fischeri]MUL10765.1 STAS domain-containing protein [Aliivibrio fischeri]MUL12911.1 STAS domain-containing protein [Aliivibrio fischeri]
MELHQFESNTDILVLSVQGDMDAIGCRDIQPSIDSVIEQEHHQIQIDLSHVAFLDSSGIGAIVYLYKRLIEKDRTMQIKNAHGQPLELLKLLRIENAIPVNKTTH